MFDENLLSLRRKNLANQYKFIQFRFNIRIKFSIFTSLSAIKGNMGIFQRLENLVKSSVNFRANKISNNFDEFNDDDELKRIIEELDSSYKSNFNGAQHKYKTEWKMPVEVQQAFELFEVSESSSVDEIKSRFKSKIKEFHPDMLTEKNENERKIAHQKTSEILKAYNVIKSYKGF